MNEQTSARLAARQLEAYNRADLDAFCDCYHDEVVVLSAQGETVVSGIEPFRARYAGKFAAGGFGAAVPERLSLGEHCVDRELYWTIDPETGARREGEVLVRYTVRDGRIAIVQFFHPAAQGQAG